MLTDRQKRIMIAVVEGYTDSPNAEPIGSSVLSKCEGLDVSTATLRNEMALLEELGYLEKTHTSSGRVPSVKGYRFYVNELLNDENISLEEIEYIKEQLETKVNEIEDLTKITTNTLSEITHYTTVAIGPSTENNLITDVRFILLGSRLLMVVILTDNGQIKETVIKYDEDINQNQVEGLNNIFNNRYKICFIR